MNELKALGPAGLLGIGLICFACSFALGSVWPMWTAYGRLQVELDALENSHAQLRTSLRTLGTGPMVDGTAQRLPEMGEIHLRLQAIQAIAVEEGLELARVGYGMEHDGASGEMHYTATLPIRAS
ncbi:hypothetical protein [Pseudothauera rhizosphaerae]|uniref:Uncharacterized protein n=1 Tax=Pseudothauera rhizosphaerae TaxID=2565932 RepID=A0A4V3W9D5_9RHOO|nr:hypothetical protein [Pseudothauera rhizosphaerae]THF54774.1 hypothetical protein E6O51_21380 [Pseudothauera rhizosphaerae]